MQRKRNFPGNELASPGQRIRFLRLALNLSQQDLATKVYATQPAVSQWENDLWLPSKQSQKLLADALGTNRAFLFGELVA